MTVVRNEIHSFAVVHSAIQHVCVLTGKSMMLNHSTLCTIALYNIISKAAMVYNLQASVYSLLPPSQIEAIKDYGRNEVGSL